MANRKKYNEKLIKLEIQRKKRLKKKLKRQKVLAGRRKDYLNKLSSASDSNAYQG